MQNNILSFKAQVITTAYLNEKKILNSIINKDKRKYLKVYLVNVWIKLKSVFSCIVHFLVGHVHCSWDMQVLYSAKKTLKLDPTVLFTHLKIILL